VPLVFVNMDWVIVLPTYIIIYCYTVELCPLKLKYLVVYLVTVTPI